MRCFSIVPQGDRGTTGAPGPPGEPGPMVRSKSGPRLSYRGAFNSLYVRDVGVRRMLGETD